MDKIKIFQLVLVKSYLVGMINFFDLSTNPKLFAILRNIINETKLNKKNSNNHL